MTARDPIYHQYLKFDDSAKGDPRVFEIGIPESAAGFIRKNGVEITDPADMQNLIVTLAEKVELLQGAAQEDEDDTRDAERWRALLAACPHMMGTAGLDHAKDGTITCRDGDGYIHAGIEFWTRASPGYHAEDRMARGQTILTLIADQIIAQGGKAVEVVL